jgi:hypothetical protein
LEEDLTKLKQKQEDQDALSLSLGFFDDVKKVK